MPTPNPSHILILSRDKAPREELAGRLRQAGHTVSEAQTLNRDEHYTLDIILIYAPSSDELTATCGSVRRHPSLKDTPLLAALPERSAAEADFSAGMDDLLLYPLRPAELLLRVRLALWRRDRTGSPQTIKSGDLTIDTANYVVRLHGQALDLTLKEYELLTHLVSNPGRVFTRPILLNSVWGYEYFGGTRTVDVHIRRLRAKLGDFGEEMIQTVRGVGYRYSPPAAAPPQ